MPQATQELRDKITKWFGNIDTTGPVAFLYSHGWVLTDDWYWHPPVTAYSASEIEMDVIDFLIFEWDFGGVVDWTMNTGG